MNPEPTFKSIRPYDLISTPGRMWSVVGVHYGAEGYEDLIEIAPLDRKAATAILVPLDLIPAEAIYRADHEAAKKAA